ncbi:10792_t:CDS:2, partial [Dentiscutata heterogama]
MTKQKQKQTNNSSDADTKTESRSSNNSKSERPRTVQPKGDSHWEGTCSYCGQFYPHAKPHTLRYSDEPITNANLLLAKQKKIAKQSELTN